MPYYYDYDYPDGFNVLSEDDWDDLIRAIWESDNPKQFFCVRYEENEGTTFDEFGNVWQAVPGFPGYEVDTNGHVRRFRNGAYKEVNQWLGKNGYYYVDVYDENGRYVKKCVHRMIVEAFWTKLDYEKVTRHLNDIRTDNRLENLSWGTQAENNADMVRNGHDTWRREVYCYETDTVYHSCAEAANTFGLDKSLMNMACRGIVHTAGGKHFCYAEDAEEKLQHLDEWLRPHDGKKGVIAKNLDTGEELHFPSRKEAGIALGIPNCGISSVLTGYLRHTHGWTFTEAGE